VEIIEELDLDQIARQWTKIPKKIFTDSDSKKA